MLIELLAVETSGLSAPEDHVIEWSVGRYDTVKRSCSTDHGFILPPPGYDFGSSIVEFHTASGLLPELLKATSTPIKLGPANLRVLWSKSFALPFLPPEIAKLYVGALDGKTMVNMWCAQSQRQASAPPASRALAKVEHMAVALNLSCKE